MKRCSDVLLVYRKIIYHNIHTTNNTKKAGGPPAVGPNWFSAVIFNLEVVNHTMVMNHFWRGHQQIVHIDSCITFALFKFQIVVIRSEQVAVISRGTKNLKTTG